MKSQEVSNPSELTVLVLVLFTLFSGIGYFVHAASTQRRNEWLARPAETREIIEAFVSCQFAGKELPQEVKTGLTNAGARKLAKGCLTDENKPSPSKRNVD